MGRLSQPLFYKNMLKLTERLQLVADCLEPCECFADIGTDHAYLPVWMLQNGKARFAIAADINPNPLKNARNTLAQYGFAEQIELRLSDGLQNIDAWEVGAIAVAGMGGNQIADMIVSTPWLQSEDIQLVLQPMTHFEDVRRALRENGFSVLREETAAEGERVYLVLSARYSGEVKTYPEWYDYAGTLPQNPTETNVLFLKKVTARLQKRAEALQTTDAEESKRLFRMKKEIQNACRADLCIHK